jgi:hypothetical protein
MRREGRKEGGRGGDAVREEMSWSNVLKRVSVDKVNEQDVWIETYVAILSPFLSSLLPCC